MNNQILWVFVKCHDISTEITTMQLVRKKNVLTYGWWLVKLDQLEVTPASNLQILIRWNTDSYLSKETQAWPTFLAPDWCRPTGYYVMSEAEERPWDHWNRDECGWRRARRCLDIFLGNVSIYATLSECCCFPPVGEDLPPIGQNSLTEKLPTEKSTSFYEMK